VAAEVVVIVQNENLGVTADVLQKIVRGAKSAQPAADDDEVVGLAGALRAGQLRAFGVAQ
jgi:hypothetical protein